MYIYFTISFLRNTGAKAALDNGRWLNRCHARESGHRATLRGVGFPLASGNDKIAPALFKCPSL
jgi:hypothetical protein